MVISIRITALEGVPEIAPGQALDEVLAISLKQNGITLADNDAVVFCQKVVSKSENRYVELASVTPSQRALDLAAICGKDARLVELVLSQSTEVVRCIKDVLIVRHTLGFVVANAAIDQSNISHNLAGGSERALLLPVHPDRSAANIRAAIQQRLSVKVGVLISDSFGRPWRIGVSGVGIGCAGMSALIDERGRTDRFGRELQVTQIAVADQLAAAAVTAMGEADEGRPIVVVSGLPVRYFENDVPASALVRPIEQDLFK
jgi:coenzyme F420-0:L-glutamate ligase/coenzyme F420-1:gamma-L-glutamate ligase